MVVTADTCRREFNPDSAQVRVARHYAMDMARSWGLGPSEIGIVVGELAANAVLHGRSPFTVILRRYGQRVLVEVADDNPRLPTAPAGVPPSALSGRGLRIVDQMSVGWGVLPSKAGKVVWAELDCLSQSAPQERSPKHS